ncbi:hypothetical protein [Tomitella gaofuii]|uniref:hypothetical protein n=1 Tax=Tomitella gaofuii TaxID=2760083 RepID=UPI0015F836B2|nr:hypothetical protein [Tomitella gaofuii]
MVGGHGRRERVGVAAVVGVQRAGEAPAFGAPGAGLVVISHGPIVPPSATVARGIAG